MSGGNIYPQNLTQKQYYVRKPYPMTKLMQK